MSRSISRREALKAGAIIVGGAAASPLFIQGMQALATSVATGPLPWAAANTILTTTLLPQLSKQELCRH